MNRHPPKPVSQADVATFQSEGAVCMRGLLDDEWIAYLRDAVEHAMAHPSSYARDLATEGSRRGSFFTDVFVWKHHERFLRFIRDSPIAEVAAALMGSRAVRLYNDHLLVKEPGTDAPTQWHQDQPYFRIAGAQACSVWIGLDPVRRASGAMSFVAGSHRWNRMFRPVGLSTGKVYDADEFDGEAPDVDADPVTYRTVCYEMEPGDVTIHHVLTLHGAQGNSSATTRRRGYSVRLAGDDITWLNRKFSPTGIDGGLKDGDALRGELFPALWPRGDLPAT
jgi:ectoine hydroxylase-related dioxygenase (phytanoyl-CoA dioxygenase family)